MAVKKDVLQTTLLLDGKQAINQLGKLEMEYADIRRSLKGMKKDHKDYERLAANQKKVQNEIRKTRAELGIQGMTLTQLIRYEKDLQRTRSNSTTRGTAEYKRLTAEIKKASAAIRQQRMEARGMSGMWSKMSKEVKQFGLIALSYLGFTAITSQLNNLIQRTGDFSDLLASVRKTTGLTEQEISDLNKTLGQVDTRTARKELLSMAKVAGKLGITARDDVAGFVRAFDKINVALGEDLGNPEEVARKLGKLMEAFQVNDMYGIEDGLLKVGSAINHLGKSSTANEGYIVEFTRRMAGIAPLAKLSIQNVMGIGATLDALGQTSEVSTTSLNKLFIKMTQNGETFAKYTKDANGAVLSSQQFADLIENDFNEAFISLLRGVKDNSEGMTALSDTLGDLELDGGRIIGVLGTLANNTDLLAEQQKISNEEFEKGTSVLSEFNLMNETLGAKLDKIRKRLFAAFVNTSVVSGIEKLAGWLERVTRIKLSEKLEEERASLNRLHVEILQGNTPRERRIEIINELKESYPEILGHLDAEKVSNEELTKSLKAVNEQLINRIVIAHRQEEIDEALLDAAERKEKVLEQEAELREKIAGMAEDYELAIPEADNLAEQAKKIQQAVAGVYRGPDGIVFSPVAQIGLMIRNYEASLNKLDNLNGLADELTEERDKLITTLLTPPKQNPQSRKVNHRVLLPKNLGIQPSGSNKEEESTAIDSVLGDKESQQEKINGYIARLEDGFTQERTALKQQRALGLITEDEYNTQLEDLELAHLLVMKGFREELGLSTIDIEEKIAQKQIDLINKVADERDDATDKAKENYISLQEGFQSSLQGLGQAFGAFADVQDQTTERGIDRALRASNAMVIANKAAALSSAIAGATAAAAATGPGAPFALAGYIASMVGMVLAGFGQIKQNQKSANTAKQDLRESKSEESSGRSYYDGGWVDDYGVSSSGDRYGRFSEYPTHLGEYVTPAYQAASDPKSIDAIKVLEARRNGYSLGVGSGSMNVNSTLESGGFDAAVDKLGAYIGVLIDKGIEANIYYRKLEDHDDFKEDRNRAASRGSLS